MMESIVLAVIHVCYLMVSGIALVSAPWTRQPRSGHVAMGMAFQGHYTDGLEATQFKFQSDWSGSSRAIEVGVLEPLEWEFQSHWNGSSRVTELGVPEPLERQFQSQWSDSSRSTGVAVPVLE